MMSPSPAMSLSYIQKNRVSLAMLVLYAVVIGFFMYHHEMWRDEIEYFLYRKHHGITNPGDPCYLVYNIPANLLLLFGSTLGVYKIYHFFIIVATSALILLCSPFSNIEKFLITFSYYLTYEYGIMSRYYGMFCLLVLLITWVLASRRENYVLLSVLILCLADLNSSGTLFAVCFSLFAAFRVVTGLRSGTIAWKGNSGMKTGLVIMGLGWGGLAVFYKLYLLNLAKNLTYGGAVPPLHIAISSLLNAYLPIPDLTKGSSFWSTHLFGYHWCFPEGYSFSWGQITPQEIGCALASLGIFVVIGVAFWRERAVAILYLFNTVLMIGFFRSGMKVFPSRYLGLLFLILVYCYWLFKSSRQKSGDEQTSKSISGGDHTLLGGLRKAFKPLLYVILGSQVITAVYALGICLNHQFTLSQDAASFIKWNKLQQSHVLVGYPDYAAQCISAHLDQKIFYPQQGRFAYSSGDFLDDFKRSVPASELFGSCLRFTEGEGKKVLLILNFPLMADREHVLTGPVLISKNSSIELLQAVTGDVINQDEQFWLYEVAKIP